MPLSALDENIAAIDKLSRVLERAVQILLPMELAAEGSREVHREETEVADPKDGEVEGQGGEDMTMAG